ncbi:MAG: ABC transporter permease [Planctomycetes bacterium]|nr:ABC transporter permease [Planctomycetota bacterium]
MILVIAGATCREAVRSRAFLGLLVIFVCGILLARLVGAISATDGNIVTTDLVFSLQSLIGVLVAVATGTALVHTEVRQHTLYTVLSRPMARWRFVLGKYLGLAAALALGQIAMLATGLAWLWATGAELHGWLLIGGLLTIVEVLVMAAVSLCWTALSSPLLAAVLGLATWAAGHAVSSLPGLIHHLDGCKQQAAIVLASLVPDLGRFAYRNDAVHRTPIEAVDLALAFAYGSLWIALLVAITVAVYRRKQL